MIRKSNVYAIFIILGVVIGCSEEKTIENELPNQGPSKDEVPQDDKYDKKDTLVYLSFNGHTLDKSLYEHEVTIDGETSFVYNRDSIPNSAAFFDGNTSLSLQIKAHDTIEFDFWFAPYVIAKGQSIMDYMEGLFSIGISDIDTSYVNSFGSATYMISAISNFPEKETRNFELRPYPQEFDEFDLSSSVWKHVQIKIGQGINPILYINGFRVGQFDNELPLSMDRSAVIVIGADHETNNFFHGKIDDFVIRNFTINP